MSEDTLRAHLSRLRAELAAAHDLDPDTREELHQLARAVETALESRTETGSVRERLADRVREVEASHPRLSSTIGNLVDTLAFYGI